MVWNPSKWLHAFRFKLMRLSAALLKRPLHAHKDDQTPKKTDKDKFLPVFQQLDRDGDGKVSTEELAAYFLSVDELALPHEETMRVFFELDSDGDGFVGFDDFVGLMEESSVDESMKMAFEMYEVESGSGGISAEGLQRMLGKLGFWKTTEECAEMIRAFDVDGNGVMDFNEFKIMMS